MSYKNLACRLESEFITLEQEALADLKERDLEYALLLDELETLRQKYPFLVHVFAGNQERPLSSEEKGILAVYQNRIRWKDLRERRHLYFLGHGDALSYFEKVRSLYHV